MNNLKLYCKYLIDEYIKVNENYSHSCIYWDLYSFFTLGKITDTVYINTKKVIKIIVLNSYGEVIEYFLHLNSKDKNIKTFNQFIRKEKIKKLL